MNKEQLQTAKLIEERLEELNTEILALFDAPKKINPKKPFLCRGHIHGAHISEVEITLTIQDINVLQAIRTAEKEGLESLLANL